MIATAIRQPVTVVVAVILVVLAGLVALDRIPVQLTPNVEDTIVAVRTFWEGASPQEIEQEIVDVQEEKLQGIANVKAMTSTSIQSQGTIRLEFKTGTPKEDALREVSDKLREIPSYPDTAEEPVIEASDPDNRDYIAWIVFTCSDPTIDVRTLQDFIEDRVEPTLERVPGISEINVLGGTEREVQIRFDPLHLAERGITVSEFVAAIRATNRNVSAGELQDAKSNVRIRTVSQYSSVKQVERTVIRQTPAGPVFLEDLATVVETFKEPRTFVRSKGRPVIAINAQKEVGANVMEVMAGLQAAVRQIDQPGGILDAQARKMEINGEFRLTQVFDQTIYIDDALALVQSNIWFGGGLAILMLLLFLRSFRTAGIIALSIPISVVGAIVFMVAMGRTINVVSLAGMAFAVGMVVDNAIVVLENIYRHLEMGKRGFQAALDGTREVWGAVLAATLTTIVVFIPILLIQDEAGQLFRDIALAICGAVGLSLMVSITVIPAASARLLSSRVGKGPVGRVIGVVGAPFRKIPDTTARFVHSLSGNLIARVLVIAVLTAASIGGTLWLKPPADYLPTGNRNLIFGLLLLPSGYSLNQQIELAERIEQSVIPFWEAGQFEVGSPEYEAAKAKLPEITGMNFATMQPVQVTPPPLENYFIVSFDGMMFHGGICAEPEKVSDLSYLFNHATRADQVPGVMAFAFQLPLFQVGGRSGSAVKIDLSGEDLNVVKNAALATMMQLMGQAGPRSVQPDPSNFNVPGPELRIVPNRVRLAQAGLTPDDIGLTVQASGDGSIIGEYRIGDDTVDLKLIAEDSVGQAQLGPLTDLPLATPSGQVLPLESVAAVSRVAAAQQINRVESERSVTLQFTPPPNLALEEAIALVDKILSDLRASAAIPPEVVTSYSGSASKLGSVQRVMLGDGSVLGTLSSALGLALIVVYLLMCVLFQSFLKPLVILFSVPLATFGGFAALSLAYFYSLTNPYVPIQQLDVLTMLGFLILIGVVVNNAILIVHQTGNFMRGADTGDEGAREPLAPREAIREAVRSRVRPIFMGMLTSVGGMAPLVFMPGSGSELYRGLGSVVIGGLLLSTVFTLILVPLILSLTLDLQAATSRFLQRFRKEESAAVKSTVLFLLASVVFLAGCRTPKPNTAERLDTLVRDVIRSELEAGRQWSPPPPNSTLDKTLADRRQELEAMAGPSAYEDAQPNLGRDLHGEPQASLRMSLADAVTSSLEHNLGIRTLKLDPRIADESLIEARAEFDAVVFSSFDLEKIDQPRAVPILNSIELGANVAASETERFQAGIRQRQKWGTELSVTAILERFENEIPNFAFAPDPSYRGRVAFGVEQPLLRGFGTDVTEADITLSENQRKRAERALDSQLLRLARDTEQAYWDLVLAERSLMIQERLVNRGEEVRRVLEERRDFDAAQAEFADAVAVVEERDADLIRARRTLKLASDRLKALLDDPKLPLEGETLVLPSAEPTCDLLRFDLAEAIPLALRQRPEIQESIVAIEDAELRERIADNLLLPELNLVGELAYENLDDKAHRAALGVEPDEFVSYLVGFTFEIPFGNARAEAEVRRRAFEKDRSLLACRQVMRSVILEVKGALREVQTGYELVLATRTSRLAASENLRALLVEKSERSALTPEFLAVEFQRQDRLARAERTEYSALVEYNQAMARFYAAIGSALRHQRRVTEE